MDDRDKEFADLISDFHLDGIKTPDDNREGAGAVQPAAGGYGKSEPAGYDIYRNNDFGAGAPAGDGNGGFGYGSGIVPPPPDAGDDGGEFGYGSEIMPPPPDAGDDGGELGYNSGIMPPPPGTGDNFAPPMPPPPDSEDDDDSVKGYSLNIDYDPELKAMPDAAPQRVQTAEEGRSRAEHSSAPKKKRRKGRLNGLWAMLWLVCTLALAGWLAVYGINSINDLIGFNKTSREVEVTIPEGATLSDIARILNEAGVIDEPFTFKLYANIKKKEGVLQPGTYTLSSSLGYDQIFISLGTSNVSREVVSVTIYEGMSASEIGELLQESRVCDADDFLKVVDTGSFDYEFEDMMGSDPLIYHKWEGYLFPDTYEFYVDDDADAVVQKMVANFNNRVESKYYEQMKSMGMTLEDTITLASIIQSEAGIRTDMETISSVFHNRLNYSAVYPNLESDVTYFYYRDEIKGDPNITSAEKQDAYHEAYDTYFCLGLPVGPICNPGLDAIEAALYPADTEYYFFVTDNNGQFYYALTMEQHELNVAEADRVNAQLAADSSSEG